MLRSASHWRELTLRLHDLLASACLGSSVAEYILIFSLEQTQIGMSHSAVCCPDFMQRISLWTNEAAWKQGDDGTVKGTLRRGRKGDQTTRSISVASRVPSHVWDTPLFKLWEPTTLMQISSGDGDLRLLRTSYAPRGRVDRRDSLNCD